MSYPTCRLRQVGPCIIGLKPNSHDIINQITRIDGGLGTLYTSHYKIGYSIPAIVKNGRPQRNLYIAHYGYIKMDISKYTQTFIKDHHNNMQVMIGKEPLKTSQI